MIGGKLSQICLCHALIGGRIGVEETRHLVVGPVVVETTDEAEGETEGEYEDNHGGDDEAKNTGESAMHSDKLSKFQHFGLS